MRTSLLGVALFVACVPVRVARGQEPASAQDPSGLAWVQVPESSFSMGSEAASDDAKPLHTVTLPAFAIAATEVTVRQYRGCVTAGGCTAGHWDDGTCHVPLGSEWGRGTLPEALRAEDLPMVCVDWEQARRFAEWAGGRLCTEAEWESAARSGGQPRRYPWGPEEPTCARAVMNDPGPGCGAGRPAAPCSRVEGRSEQGVCDLLGNVSEWVADWLQPYREGPLVAPEGPLAGAVRVVRGGGFADSAWRISAAIRRPAGPTRSAADRGIRVCR